MPSSPCLRLGAALVQLAPHPVETAVDDAPLLAQVRLGVFQGGDLPRDHLLLQSSSCARSAKPTSRTPAQPARLERWQCEKHGATRRKRNQGEKEVQLLVLAGRLKPASTPGWRGGRRGA